MIPQHQTILGTGKNGEPRGNCFATAIACILELPVDAVPNFCEQDHWIEALNEWLAPRMLFYLEVFIPDDNRDQHYLFKFAGYHVITGQGPRGCRHSVIGNCGAMIHDPHPSGAGLLTEEEYGFLIPLNPAN
jgi:hypothetical protein